MILFFFKRQIRSGTEMGSKAGEEAHVRIPLWVLRKAFLTWKQEHIRAPDTKGDRAA